MPRPDEGMIHAWLDGELGAEEAERVAKLAAEDPEWSAAVAEARGLIAASSRIVTALDVIPGGVVPAGSRAAGAPAAGSRAAAVPKPRFTVRPWMRMAAGVVLLVGTATVVMTRTANPPGSAERQLAVTVEQARSGAPPQASADEAGAAPRSVGLDAARESVAAGAADEVKKAVVGGAVARQALNDSVARPNANVAAAGIAAQSGAREADALKRAEAERTAADARPSVTEASAAPSTPAPAPAAKTAAAFRERRADLPAEVGAAGRVVWGVTAGGVAQRDAAAVKAAASADVAVATQLEGCWTAVITGRPDSLLVAPRILREAGDTLMLVVAADGRTATVRRDGKDVLRGDTRFGSAAAVVFVGTRVACPVAP